MIFRRHKDDAAPTIVLSGAERPVLIREHPRARAMKLRYDAPSGEVRITVPRGTSRHLALNLAKDHRAWLERQAGDLAPAEREEMFARATQVLAEPAFAEVFGPRALAEVPLAATVEGQVVMGTADRLLVTADAVTVVDFKTARRPPLSPEAIPDATLKQMAAYVAALETIYPGRRVEAAVLYTQTPQLFALPAARLAA